MKIKKVTVTTKERLMCTSTEVPFFIAETRKKGKKSYVIRKGDVVGRSSYGNDIFFVVEKIIRTDSGQCFAILKGLTVRIVADSPVEDLNKIEKEVVENRLKSLNTKMEDRIRNSSKMNKLFFSEKISGKRLEEKVYSGKILHLDGDRKYSEKSIKYYKQLGLDAIVKNIPENKQAMLVRSLLERYQPDILVITGHDAMLKNNGKYNDIYNYRNSRHFINTVKEARKWEPNSDKLVIFAGACQSYYEAIMMAGADFASSPARILIDFIDPLIVAEKIATTSDQEYIRIEDFAGELKGGLEGIGGVGVKGKQKTVFYRET